MAASKKHLVRQTGDSYACTRDWRIKVRGLSFEDFKKSDNLCQRCLNSYSYKKYEMKNKQL